VAAESEFDPIPFGAQAARVYGQVTAAVTATGRKPHSRITDLMTAAIAITEDLPLYTTPDDFAGLEDLLTVVPVTHPHPAGTPVARTTSVPASMRRGRAYPAVDCGL
jgi:hypothetical protein